MFNHRAILCALALALPGAAWAQAYDPKPPALALSVQPSPSRGETTIAWAPSGFAPATVVVIDARGHVVRHLAANTNVSSLRWDGLDDKGLRARSGVYFVHLRVADVQRSRRLILLRG